MHSQAFVEPRLSLGGASFAREPYIQMACLSQIMTLPRIFKLIIFYTILHIVTLLVYRLYWSPLASFSGPVLAKTTHLYEIYHNFILAGIYYEKIRESHCQVWYFISFIREKLNFAER